MSLMALSFTPATLVYLIIFLDSYLVSPRVEMARLHIFVAENLNNISSFDRLRLVSKTSGESSLDPEIFD